jgi:hypothetical protein
METKHCLLHFRGLRAHAEENGCHFFDRAAMRFFSSRLCGTPRMTACGRAVVFVTSERFHGSGGYSAPRKYTVRIYDVEGAGTWNAYGFQRFDRGDTAKRVAGIVADTRIPADMAVSEWASTYFPESSQAEAS